MSTINTPTKQIVQNTIIETKTPKKRFRAVTKTSCLQKEDRIIIKPSIDRVALLWERVEREVINEKQPKNTRILKSYRSLNQFLHFNQKAMDCCSYLNLSGIHLKFLPDRLVQSLKNVAYLDLSNNSIEYIPPPLHKLASFCNNPYVDISNNPIKFDKHTKFQIKKLIEKGIYFFAGGYGQEKIQTFLEDYQGSLFSSDEEIEK